ncbi:hypothetical protein EDD15DRAFT_2194000 [Pisolithus albus]|nr:hypothetical protein EDD15DRAFT_2194000 [Pisolithus albus]
MLWFCTRLSSLFVTCGHALLFFDVLANALDIGQQYYWSPVVTSVVPVRTFETIDEPRDAVVRVPIAARSQDGRRTTLPLISSQIFNFRLGGVARVKAANGDRKYFPSLSDSGEGRCSERRKKRRTMWNCCYMMEEASDAHAEATEQLDEYGLWLSRPHYKTLGILMCDQRVAPASAGVPLAKAFAHARTWFLQQSTRIAILGWLVVRGLNPSTLSAPASSSGFAVIDADPYTPCGYGA